MYPPFGELKVQEGKKEKEYEKNPGQGAAITKLEISERLIVKVDGVKGSGL